MKIFNEEIYEYQVRELYRSTLISLVGHLSVIVVFTIVLYREYQARELLYWATFMLSVLGYRYIIYKKFKQEGITPKNARFFFKHFLIGLVLSNFALFLIFVFVFPESEVYQIFMIMIMSGVVSIGVLQVSYTYITARTFLVSSFAAFVISLLFQGENIVFFFLLALSYFMLMLKISEKMISWYMQAKTLQQKYYHLIQDHKVNQQRMQHLFNNTPIGIFFYDESLKITFFNEYFANEIIGTSKEKLLGLDLRNVNDKRILPTLQEVFTQGTTRYIGAYETTLSQRNLWIDLAISRVDLEQRQEGLGVVLDLTELKEAQDEIELLAYYDELTGLSKRAMILKDIEKAIYTYKREQVYSALIYFDLDKFKDINDSLGHNVGDEYLKFVAQQVKKAVRENDVISRMGGDEFAILLAHLAKDEETALLEANEVAHRVLDNINQTAYIDNKEIRTTASLGIVLIDDTKHSGYEVIKAADTAMYKAKTKNNAITIFDSDLAQEVECRYRIKEELIDAITNKEFILHLQPKYNNNAQIISAEALIRWNHPTKGLLYPDEFLPVAMDFKLMNTITFEVIALAKEILEELPQEISLSINIVGSDIYSKEFYTILQENLGEHFSRLDIELTEQELIDDIQKAIEYMSIFHKQGVSFSIDDFGTGYSSLSYLKKLQVDYLKIDKGFVMDMDKDENDLAIVKTVIAIAKSMDLEVVAEGVETQEHFHLLQKMGCDVFQGYYFAKPMEIEKFLTLLKQ